MNLQDLFSANPEINVTLRAEDLLNFGKSIAECTAQAMLDKKDEKVYTRQEVIDKFKVSAATLWRWDKMGLIKGKRLGNRRYYPESEVNSLMSSKA